MHTSIIRRRTLVFSHLRLYADGLASAVELNGLAMAMPRKRTVAECMESRARNIGRNNKAVDVRNLKRRSRLVLAETPLRGFKMLSLD